MIISIIIKSCKECPMRHHHCGHGENWDECRHPSAPKGYCNIIEGSDLFPSFCPGLESNHQDNRAAQMPSNEKETV